MIQSFHAHWIMEPAKHEAVMEWVAKVYTPFKHVFLNSGSQVNNTEGSELSLKSLLANGKPIRLSGTFCGIGVHPQPGFCFLFFLSFAKSACAAKNQADLKFYFV